MALKGQKEPAIRKIYRPDDQERKNLRHVYERKEEMSDKRAEFSDKWDDWEKQWDSYRLPKDVDDWRSNIYIPLTASIIESQLAEIIDLDLMPWVVERGSEDASQAAVMNAILEYTWDVSKSDLALYEILITDAGEELITDLGENILVS